MGSLQKPKLISPLSHATRRRPTRPSFPENAQKLADADRQADDYGQKLAKAAAKLDHMTLRAPLSGTIQASSVTTVGQVLTSGEEIMRIVPEDAALEIECYLPNQDIGFVKEGQDAVVKIGVVPLHPLRHHQREGDTRRP